MTTTASPTQLFFPTPYQYPPFPAANFPHALPPSFFSIQQDPAAQPPPVYFDMHPTRKACSKPSQSKALALGGTHGPTKKKGRTREEKSSKPHESYPCVEACGKSFSHNDVHYMHMKTCIHAIALAQSLGLRSVQSFSSRSGKVRKLTPVERLTRVVVERVREVPGVDFGEQAKPFVHWDPCHCNIPQRRYRFKRVYVVDEEFDAHSTPSSSSTQSSSMAPSPATSTASLPFGSPSVAFAPFPTPTPLASSSDSPPKSAFATSSLWTPPGHAFPAPSSSGITTHPPAVFAPTDPAAPTYSEEDFQRFILEQMRDFDYRQVQYGGDA